MNNGKNQVGVIRLHNKDIIMCEHVIKNALYYKLCLQNVEQIWYSLKKTPIIIFTFKFQFSFAVQYISTYTAVSIQI